MPRKIKYRDEFRPFNLWMNDLRNSELDPYKYRFSFSDLDGILIADQPPNLLWFMLEVKTHGQRNITSASQLSIINLLQAIGDFAHNQVVNLKLWGRLGDRRLKWLGFHVLTLSETTPDDSEWMLWDKFPIDRDCLVKVLRFENDPRDPMVKL